MLGCRFPPSAQVAGRLGSRSRLGGRVAGSSAVIEVDSVPGFSSRLLVFFSSISLELPPFDKAGK